MEHVDKIKPGDRITVSGVGLNKSGDVIQRTRNDNKISPFWGTNLRTGKRGQAVKLTEFKA
ncbi:hypothetical protein KAR91_36265 [Candidatus Pacearchaeota archaeon]|nr:hypothetical protein [Candidatus Pacearchaeota archaeon]